MNTASRGGYAEVSVPRKTAKTSLMNSFPPCPTPQLRLGDKPSPFAVGRVVARRGGCRTAERPLSRQRVWVRHFVLDRGRLDYRRSAPGIGGIDAASSSATVSLFSGEACRRSPSIRRAGVGTPFAGSGAMLSKVKVAPVTPRDASRLSLFVRFLSWRIGPARGIPIARTETAGS